MADIIMDTHIHSKASDGMWTPSEVVEHADRLGLKVIALTDHETTYGIDEAIQRSKENDLDVKVIPGVEIDAEHHCEYNGNQIVVKDIEILGLCINTDLIQEFLDNINQNRSIALQNYINSFNRYIKIPDFESRNSDKTFKLDLSKVTEISYQHVISWRGKRDNYDNPRPFLSKMDIIYYVLQHFAISTEEVNHALNGISSDINKFRAEYEFLFKSEIKKPTFYEAIEAVKNASGLAILAHPGAFKGYKHGMIKEWEKPEAEWFTECPSQYTPYKFVKDLKDHGLDGIELYYYRNDDRFRINYFFNCIADLLGLKVTYGTDCHGNKGSGPHLGKFGARKIYLDC